MTEQITKFILEFAHNFLQSFASQFVVISIFYLLIWKIFESKLKRFRIQIVKRAGSTQIREEIKNSIIVILGGVIITPIILILQQLGYTKIYVDINQYGVWYFLFNTLIIWIIADTWFYWAHRLLHHSKVYRYIHAIHHQSLDTTPYTTLSFHFLEPLILSAWIYIVIFLFPVNLIALGINQVLGLLNNIKSHLGYEFYPKWFDRTVLKYLVNSTHHNQHHTRYNGNYGLSFRFWDMMFGTEFSDYDQVVREVKNRKDLASIIDNSTYRSIKIFKIEQETLDSCSVYFQPKDKNFYNYQPGQYINLRIKIRGRIYDRVFSLSSSPVVDNFLRITVKKHSIVTNYFMKEAKVGNEIQALYPCGDFTVILNSIESKNYLMIAGGSGITPLYSMIRSILATEANSKVTLFYANRNTESTIFAKEIEELRTRYSNFVVSHFISGQKRLNQQAIAEYMQKNIDSEIYLCGSESLKASVKGYLNKLSVKKELINQEDFVDGYVNFFQANPTNANL